MNIVNSYEIITRYDWKHIKIIIRIHKNTIFSIFYNEYARISILMLNRCNLLIDTFDLSHLSTFYDKKWRITPPKSSILPFRVKNGTRARPKICRKILKKNHNVFHGYTHHIRPWDHKISRILKIPATLINIFAWTV